MTAACDVSRTAAALIVALVDVTAPQIGPVLILNAFAIAPPSRLCVQ